MKIGSLKLKNRIFLAPMAEVNDIAFRKLCLDAGAGLVFTGMINPLSKQEIDLDDKPALQLFSTNEKGVKEFIKKYEDKVKLFDFNLGCPAKTAKKLGFGSYLGELETIEKILKTMRESTKKPITVKIRKSKKALKILKIAEKYCDAISVHPRTKEQGYSGEPDLDFALRIKKRTKLPVIYSGNVNEDNLEERLKQFDFVMIGRKAMGNPNFFSKVLGKKTNFNFLDYLNLAKEYNLKFRIIKFQSMWFTKGLEGGAKVREQIAKAKTIKEIKEIYSKEILN
ncbi:tRNA-dihydrouridine synthase family protein [archaeon]|mgnify:FL=1|jgi:tRNA-dihydrouridine synthase B|nr:tRNA-dihydrouridine synthase family protein [archaeon]